MGLSAQTETARRGDWRLCGLRCAGVYAAQAGVPVLPKENAPTGGRGAVICVCNYTMLKYRSQPLAELRLMGLCATTLFLL